MGKVGTINRNDGVGEDKDVEKVFACRIIGNGGDIVCMMGPLQALTETQRTNLTVAVPVRWTSLPALVANRVIPWSNEKEASEDLTGYDRVINLGSSVHFGRNRRLPEGTDNRVGCPCVRHEKETGGEIYKDRIQIFSEVVGVPPQVYRFKADPEPGKNFLSSFSPPYVAISFFTADSTKNWLWDRWLQLILSLPDVTFIQVSREVNPLLNTSGPKNFTQVVDAPLHFVLSLVSNCHACVTADTFLSHIAGSLDVPTLALMGPTHPLTMRQYPRTYCLWGGYETRCDKTYYGHTGRVCCYGRATCMQNITTSLVVARLQEMLNNAGRTESIAE